MPHPYINTSDEKIPRRHRGARALPKFGPRRHSLIPITTTPGVHTNQQPFATRKPARTDISGECAMPATSHASALLIVAMTSVVMASVALTPMTARAENIDQDKDKSGPKLFAATCAECHRSARGLAKGRLSIMLQYYLKQHYTSSSATAQTLTAYLQSVDTPPRSKPQPGKSSASAATASAPRPPATQSAATTTGLSVPRPPALVPGR